MSESPQGPTSADEWESPGKCPENIFNKFEGDVH